MGRKQYGTLDTGVDAELAATAQPRRKQWLAVAVAVSVAALTGGAAHYGRTTGTSQLTSVEHPEIDGAEKMIFQKQTVAGRVLTASNQHERRMNMPIASGYGSTYHGSLVVQVLEETHFQYEGYALWKIEDDSSVLYWSGDHENELKFAFPHVGDYKMTIIADGIETGVRVHSRTIRYELRDLDKESRSRYFDALETVYNTEQKVGEKLYGSKFKSAAWLVREHLYGAGSPECDHWHDDAGILNHHIGITWQLEQSLLSVDPKTAAHYWDYTREAGNNATEWYESNMFKDSWFGSSSSASHSHAITSGRWAYLGVMKEAREFSDITNSYGLLRSPWNTNPTPYVMRHNKTLWDFADSNTEFPSCSEFESTVGETTLATMLNRLNGLLHGPVHIMIGGHWGYSDVWKPFMTMLDDVGTDEFLLFSKFLWRQGYVRVPDYCSSDTPASKCTSSCPMIDGEMFGLNATQILEKSGAHSLLWSSVFEVKKQLGVTDHEFLMALCHMGHPGEMFSSAAPYDPIFWPLHGQAERFVMMMRIAKDEGKTSFSEEWGYTHSTYNPSDTGTICDWTNVTGMEMPSCSKGTCPGHKAEDTLPFKHLVDGQGSSLFTNAEFYNLTSPGNLNLPYVYHALNYWPACGNLI